MSTKPTVQATQRQLPPGVCAVLVRRGSRLTIVLQVGLSPRTAAELVARLMLR